MEGFRSTQVNTQHAQGTEFFAEYGLRSILRRLHRNNGVTAVNDTTDRTAHTAY